MWLYSGPVRHACDTWLPSARHGGLAHFVSGGGAPFMGKLQMVRPRFVLEDTPKLGWRSVFLVNALGQLLNTEPVCAYPERYHEWFGEWIVRQEVPFELPDVAPPKRENGE